MNKKFLAFSLAEVLVTIGIIGVIASITIIALIQNYQKTQYVEQLKKAYSEVNQVLTQMSNDWGSPGDLTGAFTSDKISGTTCDSACMTDIGDRLSAYFKLYKNCKMTEDIDKGVCFSNKASTNFDGSATRTNSYDLATRYRFATLNGISFMFSPYGYCKTYNKNGTGVVTCGVIDIDTNGAGKGPNNYGIDIHRFAITNRAGIYDTTTQTINGTNRPLLYPYGGLYYDYYRLYNGCFGDNTTYGKSGSFCAARIIEEGWKMSY